MIASFLTQTFADNALGFVLTALAVASVMATTVVILARRATIAPEGGERALWGLLLAAVSGTGVWTTHFVAMLGFRPDVIIAYNPIITFASAAISILCVGGPLMASCYARTMAARAGCGAMAGLGVGAMHFTGMNALEGCLIRHDVLISLVALALGAAFFASALAFKPGRRMGLAAVLIVLGVCSLHFTALYGLATTSTGMGSERGINPAVLSALVVFASLALSGMAGAALYTESRLEGQRRLAEIAQSRHNDLFLLALRNMSNGLVMVSDDGRVNAFNPRALEILGLETGDASSGILLIDMLAVMARRLDWGRDDVAEFVELHRGWLASDAPVRVEHRFANARTLQVTCQRIPEGGTILSYDDVSEHRATQDAMVHMAYHDPLTGLPNRRSFREEVQRMPARPGGVAVLMLDLDHFKAVNDTSGQLIGDALLTQVADRLRRTCRAGDRLFRLGSDELAVIGNAASDAESRMLAEALRASLDAPFRIEGQPIQMGCSIGFAWGRDGKSGDLVEKADLALFRAKELGRGRVESYESGMMERALLRRQTEADLATALDNREFELHYQPLYALPSRRLVGFEALVRWRHPQRGMVSPAEFIPISESNGLILKIGAWVLEEACRQLARWPGDLHVAINASAVQLHSPAFVDEVAAALARHAVPAGRLEIELTETAMVEDGRQMSEMLKRMRALGVRIAMDDFGTGYSSLAHLRDFELDRIKIDRSFVATDLNDIGSRAVIRAVTSLARDLNIVTVGEGIETEEQLQRLIELGCDVAQGYFLSKPLDAVAAGQLISVRMFEDDLADERRAAKAAAEPPRRYTA